MSLVVPDSAELIVLSLFLAEDVTLKLYSNDQEPAADDVLADYTEVAGGSYAAKTLAALSWTIATSSGQAVATYALQTWTFSGVTDSPGTVYGYFVIRGTDLLWAERFNTEDPLEPALNDTINVTPRLTAESVF